MWRAFLLLSGGVIGNIPDFGSGDFWFESRLDNNV